MHAPFLPCLIGKRITKLFQWCCFRFVALDRWWPCRDMFWWQATNPTTSNSGCKSRAAESSWGSLKWGHVGITTAGSRGNSTPYSPIPVVLKPLYLPGPSVPTLPSLLFFLIPLLFIHQIIILVESMCQAFALAIVPMSPLRLFSEVFII